MSTVEFFSLSVNYRGVLTYGGVLSVNYRHVLTYGGVFLSTITCIDLCRCFSVNYRHVFTYGGVFLSTIDIY